MAVCFGQMSLTNFLDLGWWIGSIPRSSARKTQDRRPAERQRARTKKKRRCLVERDGRALSKSRCWPHVWVFNPKDLRNRSVSHCSETSPQEEPQLWDLRANVVFGRASSASLCARSFRGERPQFADCWCFCGVHGYVSRSWSWWLCCFQRTCLSMDAEWLRGLEKPWMVFLSEPVAFRRVYVKHESGVAALFHSSDLSQTTQVWQLSHSSS